jgi:small conductance mechanosensitive channel
MDSIGDVVAKDWDQIVAYATTYGLNVVGGVVLLVVGWTAAGWAAGATDLTLARVHSFDLTLRRFVASLVRYLILTFTVLAVLSQFGVQTASLIAVFGAAGLAIGLALQGTLANLAAGVMILIFRPFKIGDLVDAGGSRGTVESIDLFTTELRPPDNVQLLVPNGKIWGTAITNFSVHQTRRVDLKMVIDGAADLDQTIATIREVLSSDKRTLAERGVSVSVAELGEATATLEIQGWTTRDAYGDLKFALIKTLKQRLQGTLKTLTGP